MERFNLCYGCMEPIDENAEVCPRCGYHMGAPHLPSYLAPGTMLNDRYMVGKLRGYNGESASYIGFDTITETKVVIKEYMPDPLCKREKGGPVINVDPNCVAQYKTLLSEFVELNKILSKMRTLNHINAAIDMFGDNNTAYAVFGWLDGCTLGEYLKQHSGKLSWEEVKKLFPPIFTTLSLVHNAGLIHRGISPENIIITEKGELKLTGFCIADARTSNTELIPEIYNGYAAPEQYSSNNWQGTWTDVYGISALLYRILTGTVPDDAVTRMSGDELKEPAKIDHSIPSNVSRVIMNGLCLNGEMRIQTITELVTQLFEQPEYGSSRLSSSSTQTITIPRQGNGRKKKKKKSSVPSRHSLFIMIIAIILCVGMFFLLMVVISKLDDTSGRYNTNVNSGLSTITDNGSEPDSAYTTSVTIAPITEASVITTTSEQSNVMVYVMNDLTGMTYDAVSSSAGYSSLVFTPEYEYNDEFARGQIFSQSIPENDIYEEGAEITVKVSLGPKYITIPEYEGMNKKDYFTKLDSLGIKYEEKEELTEDVLEGYVYKTSKEAGEKIDVEIGETLTVFVAKNPPKTETETVTETSGPAPEETAETSVPVTGEPDVVITFFD